MGWKPAKAVELLNDLLFWIAVGSLVFSLCVVSNRSRQVTILHSIESIEEMQRLMDGEIPQNELQSTSTPQQ